MAEGYSDAEPGANPEASSQTLGIDILTLFPDMFRGPFDESMIRRAQDAGHVDIRVHDLRQWTDDRHRTADDYAYGGGGGMVLKAGPVFRAVESLLDIDPIETADSTTDSTAEPRSDLRPALVPIIMMTPQGRQFDHELALELASHERIVILCGHYEGFDERIRQHLVSHEVSVGDFVLTGGEIPAMLVTDAVARLRPGVVGSKDATRADSFATGLLEHPHYTRPADFRGLSVPDILLSGNHGAVDRWRRQEALRRTFERRPELLDELELSREDRDYLSGLQADH
jgi:tRNA (guanine37-N1)-methyltransferase